MSIRSIHPLLLSLVTLFMSACSDSTKTRSGVEERGKIGMTCMSLTNPFFKLIANVMEEEAGKHGYKLVALDGANDGAAQNAQLADFVAPGYDAIFLNPADSKAAAE